MKNEKEILRMYVGSDKLQPYCLNPFIQKGYAVATNFHILIRVKEDVIDHQYDYYEKPNIQSVFPETREEKVLNLKDINNLLSEVENIPEEIKVGEDVECPECEGSGTVTWDYKRYSEEFDCPVCNGTGYSSYAKYVPTGKIIPNPNEFVLICGKRFRVKYISILKKTMELMDIAQIVMKYNDRPFEAAIFYFDENTEVLLMSCRNE